MVELKIVLALVWLATEWNKINTYNRTTCTWVRMQSKNSSNSCKNYPWKWSKSRIPNCWFSPGCRIARWERVTHDRSSVLWRFCFFANEDPIFFADDGAPPDDGCRCEMRTVDIQKTSSVDTVLLLIVFLETTSCYIDHHVVCYFISQVLGGMLLCLNTISYH